jgi:hypothetical protein
VEMVILVKEGLRLKLDMLRQSDGPQVVANSAVTSAGP